jgi:hypothetical protein
LAELFARIPGACILWEPLHLGREPDLAKSGFTWRTIIDPDETRADIRRIFHDILTGRRLTPHTATMCSFLQVLKREFWVVKFVRANGLIHWLTNNFTIRPPVCIIRHPCAVVSSQMHRRTKHKTVTREVTLSEWEGRKPAFAEEFLKRYPRFAPILNRVKTWEEILTAIWCMDNYHITGATGEPLWIVLPYEKLVVDGENTLLTLLAHLKLPWADRIVQGLQELSTTVVSGANITKGESPLLGWQIRLTDQQIERIFSVVNDFEMGFYTEALEPDYQFLNERSCLSFRTNSDRTKQATDMRHYGKKC